MKRMKRLNLLSRSFAGLLTVCGFSTSANAGWTYFALPDDLVPYIDWARACKTHTDSVYGPLWNVTFHVLRKEAYEGEHRIQIWVNRFDPYPARVVWSASVYQNQWLWGRVAGTGIYASQLLDDRLYFAVSVPNRWGASWVGRFDATPFQPTEIANC